MRATIPALLLLTACARTPEAATTIPSQSTTEAPPTTTTSTTTTTVQTTTTYLVQPSEDDLTSYVLLAAISLADGPFSADSIGSESWAAMLRNGVVAACDVFAKQGTIEEAVGAALRATPVASVAVDNYPVETFSLVLTLVKKAALLLSLGSP